LSTSSAVTSPQLEEMRMRSCAIADPTIADVQTTAPPNAPSIAAHRPKRRGARRT
jgi:hypothetical protein